MEYIAIAIVSFLLMLLMIKLFKNSNNRIMSQGIAVSAFFVLLFIIYYKSFIHV